MDKSRLTKLAIVTAAIFGGAFAIFLLATSLYAGIVDRQDKIDRLKTEQIEQNLNAARLLKEKKQSGKCAPRRWGTCRWPAISTRASCSNCC